MAVEIKAPFFCVMTLCSFIGTKLKGRTTQMTTRLISFLTGNAGANLINIS
jgi:hypothetical protein